MFSFSPQAIPCLLLYWVGQEGCWSGAVTCLPPLQLQAVATLATFLPFSFLATLCLDGKSRYNILSSPFFRLRFLFIKNFMISVILKANLLKKTLNSERLGGEPGAVAVCCILIRHFTILAPLLR